MVVFRVDSSSLIIDSNIAKNLPVYPKGIAVYRGVDPDTQSLQLKIVATPYVSRDIWDNIKR